MKNSNETNKWKAADGFKFQLAAFFSTQLSCCCRNLSNIYKSNKSGTGKIDIICFNNTTVSPMAKNDVYV